MLNLAVYVNTNAKIERVLDLLKESGIVEHLCVFLEATPKQTTAGWECGLSRLLLEAHALYARRSPHL